MNVGDLIKPIAFHSPLMVVLELMDNPNKRGELLFLGLKPSGKTDWYRVHAYEVVQ